MSDQVGRYLAMKNGAGKQPPSDSTSAVDRYLQLKGQSAPKQKEDGGGSAIGGIADKFLDMATAGIHPKIVGAGQALEDIVRRGINSHPIDTYEKAKKDTRSRIANAEKTYPKAASAAGAAGFFAPLAAEAPLRALAAVPGAAPQVEQVLSRLGRIGQSAKQGAGTGAVVAGLAGEGDAKDRALQVGGGGLLGGFLGGATQGGVEAVGAGRSLLASLLQPTEQKATQTVLGHMTGSLNRQGMAPGDLAQGARRALHTGSGSRVAHFGGEGMDGLTYLAANNPSREGNILHQAIQGAHRGEGAMLQRGVTAMSGVEDAAANRAGNVTRRLEAERGAEAAVNYPRAYESPPIQDENILNTIRDDPDLSEAMAAGIQIMRREQQAAALPGRLSPSDAIQNPLNAPTGETLTAEGQAFQRLWPDVTTETLVGKGFGAGGAAAPELSVQSLDYMKRGADAVIERGLEKGNLAARDAAIIRQKVSHILEAIDRAAPEYGAARGRFAEQSGLMDAAEAGTTALSRPAEDIGAELGGLASDAERGQYRTTATSSVRRKIDKRRNTADIGGQVFDNPEITQQLAELYSPEGVVRMAPFLEESQVVNRVNRSATGNSATEPRQAIRKAVDDSDAADAAQVMMNPRRAAYNLPGKVIDAHAKNVRDAVYRGLARRLSIEPGTPEFTQLLSELENFIPPGLGGSSAAAAQPFIGRASGLLSGLGIR